MRTTHDTRHEIKIGFMGLLMALILLSIFANWAINVMDMKASEKRAEHVETHN